MRNTKTGFHQSFHVHHRVIELKLELLAVVQFLQVVYIKRSAQLLLEYKI